MWKCRTSWSCIQHTRISLLRSSIQDTISICIYGYQSYYTSGSTGGYNTVIGYKNLYSTSSGEGNTSIGYNTLQDNTTGINNVALGRQALIINLSDYGGQTSDLNNHFSLENPIIPDKLKYFYNSFYSLENNNELVFYKNKSTIEYLQFLKQPIFQIVLANDTGESGFDFPILQDTLDFKLSYGLSPLENTQAEKQKVRNAFLNGLSYAGKINRQEKSPIIFKTLMPLLQQPLSDDNFQMILPFENSEMLENISIYGASIIDIKSHYNFYIKEYEKIAINTNLNSVDYMQETTYILPYSIWL